MSTQLRPVARMERELGTVIRVEGFDVGVRLRYPYLLTPLQLHVQENPHSSFAVILRLAGRASRDPKTGSGFVQLYYDRIAVPKRDWEAKERGEETTGETQLFSLDPKTTEQLTELCGAAHKEEVKQLIVKLTDSVRAAWQADPSISRIRELASDQMMQDPSAEIGVALSLDQWVESLLVYTNLHTLRGLPL